MKIYVKDGEKLVFLECAEDDFPNCCAQVIYNNWHADLVSRGENAWDVGLKDDLWDFEYKAAPKKGLPALLALIDAHNCRQPFFLADVKHGVINTYIFQGSERHRNVETENWKAQLIWSPWYPGNHNAPVRTLMVIPTKKPTKKKKDKK